MTYDEIFSALITRQKKALEFHSQLSIIFRFIGLNGFSRLHECQFYEESKMYNKIIRHFIKTHNKLIRELPMESINEIPTDWYNASRDNVTPAIISQYTSKEFQAYVKWETETLMELKKHASDLLELGEVKDFKFVSHMISDVSCELEKAKRLYYKLASTGFDVVYIQEMQTELHDKYKEKMK